MKKPERKRIPLNKDHKDRKAPNGSGEERAYTSNYGMKKPEPGTGDKRPYRPGAGDENTGERRSYSRKDGESGERFSGNKRPYGNRDSDRKEGDFKKPFSPRGEGSERRPYSHDGEQGSDRERRPFADKKPFRKREEGDFKKSFSPRGEGGEKRPYKPREGSDEKRPYGERKSFGDKKPFGKRRDETGDKRDFEKRPRKSFDEREDSGKRRRRSFDEDAKKPAEAGTAMTLNKYLAHAGISGRREAGELVKAGKVTVNKEVNTNPGYRIQEGDVVTYEGRVVKPEVAKVYVLLNKPKGFITTTEDEADRKTVMELVQGVEAERLYPVGRLDRNTTGVLLLTNDGDLAQRLTHPKYECKKIYQVTLDKDLTKAHFESILSGITLEDGAIQADALAYLETKKEIGIEIHSGRNRIVRRIFEHLGYDIEKLDRVMFAGLTKKNVPRGKYRLLTDKEVIVLKHFKG